MSSELGQRMLAMATAELKESWDALDPTNQTQVQTVLLDMGDLLQYQAGDEGLEAEVRLVASTMKDWEFVGASEVAAVVGQVVEVIVRILAEALAGAASAFIKGSP